MHFLTVWSILISLSKSSRMHLQLHIFHFFLIILQNTLIYNEPISKSFLWHCQKPCVRCSIPFKSASRSSCMLLISFDALHALHISSLFRFQDYTVAVVAKIMASKSPITPSHLLLVEGFASCFGLAKLPTHCTHVESHVARATIMALWRTHSECQTIQTIQPGKDTYKTCFRYFKHVRFHYFHCLMNLWHGGEEFTHTVVTQWSSRFLLSNSAFRLSASCTFLASKHLCIWLVRFSFSVRRHSSDFLILSIWNLNTTLNSSHF